MKTLLTHLLRSLRLLLMTAGFGLAHAALPSTPEEQKPEESKGDPALAGLSTRAIGHEFDTLTQEITDIEATIKSDTETLAKLNAIATKQESLSSGLRPVILSAEFKTWADKLKADSGQNLTNADLGAFFSLVETFAKDSTGPLVDAVREIDKLSLDTHSENSELGKVFEQYGVRYGLFSNPSTFVMMLVQFMPELQQCASVRPTLSKLTPTAPADPALREILNLICKSIIENGVPEVGKATKDGIIKIAGAAKKDAASGQVKITEDQGSLTGKKARRDQLNKELSFREKEGGSRKDKVADNLIWTIGCILVTIILGLVLIRLKHDDLSILMVRERTVIEVVSIGAFLSVVVFLGAGEFVQKETLGTLLGTLAGYLFTRRATPTPPTEGGGGGGGGGGGQTGSPGIPGKPVWSLPAKSLTLAADTPGATKHFVWFIDLSLTTAAAPAAARKIGETNTRSFTVAADLLHAGHHCQAWFQAVNNSGDGPEGPRVDFTL